MAATQPAIELPIELPGADQCLFIVGAARTGTTVLQNALNDSPDIFLFGEANFHNEPHFHNEPGTPDFAARYNAMHHAWSNQPNKSSFCPPVLPSGGSWHEYLRRMASQHRLTGVKTVITTAGTENSAERWFAFQCRNFFKSRYIFTFRDPLATLLSTQELQRYTIGAPESLVWIMRNYLAVIALYFTCMRVLPNVRAVCHEDMDRAGFDRLQDWLGVALPGAHEYYDKTRVRSYNETVLDAASRLKLAPIRSLYARLRQGVHEGFALPQLGQNNAHLSMAHFTPLGRLAREVNGLMETFDAQALESVTTQLRSAVTD